MKRLLVSVGLCVLLYLGLGAGLFNNAGGLVLAWFCLTPFAFIAVGATGGAWLRGRRPAMLSDQEARALNSYRTNGGQRQQAAAK
jgi:hypothetical protein